MTTESDLLEAQRDLPEAFRGKVEATIPQLQLQPGTYALDVGVRSGNDSPLDYLGACAQVEVLPGPSTPALIIGPSGGLRIPANWTWSNGSRSQEIGQHGT